MRKTIIINAFFFSLMVFLFSCVPIKKLYYLRENKKDTSKLIKIAPTPPVYIIHSGDMLFVKILAFDENISPMFNSIGTNITGGTEQLFINLNSYTVNDSGFIVLPVFGKIYVENLSFEQAQNKIRSNIKIFAAGADVIVKLLSFKVTFIGEFVKPGNYTIFKTNLNVIEAIATAGDLTNYGDKTKLMIIRQSENNKVYMVDLTDRALLYSDLFYIKPNDILYVEPLINKRQPIQNAAIATVSTFLASIVNLIVLLKYIAP